MAYRALQQTAPATHALAAYRTERVTNLSQQELILMLYDGAIRFCGEAKTAISDNDFNKSYHKLTRARDVVTELLAILNPDVDADVVRNLERLYNFCILSITEVNFSKDVTLLDAVVTVLSNLRSAWAEVDFDAALAEVEPERAMTNGDPAPHETDDPASHPSADTADTREQTGLTLTA